MQERKVGETFELNGRWIKCVKKRGIWKKFICKSKKKKKICIFQSHEIETLCLRTEQDKDSTGPCSAAYRTDGKSVCFIEVEKP